MNIRRAYREWARRRKYKKVVAGINKLNKIADDIEKTLPHEVSITGLINIMVGMMVGMYVMKAINEILTPVRLAYNAIRRRSHLFFWDRSN